MVRGSENGLRGRRADDLPVPRAELHEDAVNSPRSTGAPWCGP